MVFSVIFFIVIGLIALAALTLSIVLIATPTASDKVILATSDSVIATATSTKITTWESGGPVTLEKGTWVLFMQVEAQVNDTGTLIEVTAQPSAKVTPSEDNAIAQVTLGWLPGFNGHSLSQSTSEIVSLAHDEPLDVYVKSLEGAGQDPSLFVKLSAYKLRY